MPKYNIPRRCFLVLCLVLSTGCERNPAKVDVKNLIPSQMAQEGVPWPSLSNSPWPMHRHDPQRTGRSPFLGPSAGELEWSINPTGKLFKTTTGIAIGRNNEFYFPDYLIASHLFALNPDSTTIWNFEIGGGMWESSTPLIGAGDIIYIETTADQQLYAITPDGKINNKASIGAFVHELTVGIDGVFYGVSPYYDDGNFYAINPGGGLRWKRSFDSGFWFASCPAQSPDGSRIYVAGRDSSLYAISTSGDLLWRNGLAEGGGFDWECWWIARGIFMSLREPMSWHSIRMERCAGVTSIDDT